MFRNFWTAHPKGAEFLCFAFLFGVLCPGSALAQSWRWAVEDVDTTGAEQTSIVADKDGNLHLAYYMTEGFGELRYAFRSAANSRWYKMTLDKHVGEFSTGIGLDSNNSTLSDLPGWKRECGKFVPLRWARSLASGIRSCWTTRNSPIWRTVPG